MNFTDIQAEYAVLACLMVHPQTWDRVGDIVAAGDFSTPETRAIFTAASGLLNASRDADIVALWGVPGLATSGVTLGDLNAIAGTCPSPGSARQHAETVRRLSLRRELTKLTIEAQELAMSSADDPTEQITSMFSGLGVRSANRMPKPISELLVARVDYVTALSMGEIEPGWPTRIPSLDRALSGGFRAGKVYVIAARPKVGKSSLGQQLVIGQAKDGRIGGILSQEMPEDEVADRAIANVGSLAYSGLMTGRMSDEDWGRLADGVHAASQLPIYVDDEGGLSLTRIRSKARSIKGLKVLMIDYLQLCSGTGGKGSTRDGEIGEISRGIKALAKELGIAVLLLSQLNRRVEERGDKKPMLSDLRESGAIEQDADAVIFLRIIKEFNDEDGHKLIAAEIAANRSGPSSVEFGLDFRGSTQTWRESSEPIYAKKPEEQPKYRSNRKSFTGGEVDF